MKCERHNTSTLGNNQFGTEASWRSSNSRGFTLIELLMAIILVSILVGIGMPSYTQFLAKQRLTSQANDIISDALYARSEAAVRGRKVSICASSNGTACSGLAADWSRARIVFVDGGGGASGTDPNGVIDAADTVLRVEKVSGGLNIATSAFPHADYITFGPHGGLEPPGTSSGSFTICKPSYSLARQVAINIMGRPAATQISISSCP